ncbi:MAG: hypothetical protein ACFFE5_10230 [Candidatus Thorarchaeota archaeon]
MSEIFVDNNSIVNTIKGELKSSKPNTKRILKLIFDIEKEKLNKPEYFEIVGKIFKMNPDFFMKEIYETFMVKLGKMISVEKRHEMERYIIEKYCLVEDEQILYESTANVKQTELIEQKESGKYKMDTLPLTITVSSGDVFLTNYRVIAQGLLKVKGGERTRGFLFWATDLWVFTGKSKRTERIDTLIESSSVFGYQFPINNHWGLSKSKLLHIVAYFVKRNKLKCVISIKPTDKSKRDADIVAIFNLLRKDPDETLTVIKEIYDFEKLEKFARRTIWGILKSIWKGEEYLGVPKSDILNIVIETYKIDPEFFMTSIYPKMMIWKNESFLSIKEELIALLRKEGANIN